MLNIQYHKICGILIFCLLFSSIAVADYKDDIGYTALRDEFGGAVSDGGDLPMVSQIEAPILLDHDGNGQTAKIEVWAPDPTRPEFAGKTIVDASGSPPYYSGHATSVGYRFYGDPTSLASGIKTIQSFLADHWLGSGFLRGNGPYKPLSTSSRLANHSWIGNAGESNARLLERLDWVIDGDEYIQVVGPCRPSQALLGSAFNTIAVGQASGESGAGSVAVDGVYTPGRTCPQLIAPIKTASAAAPVVASAAAVLIELGHTHPSLSRDPSVVSTENRNGDTIYNAERSEVVKAALMAGADRVTHNTVIIDGNTPNIVEYRSDPANRTKNGLDRRYGAGQVNIYHSYRMIAAGEQNSQEDQPGSAGRIGPVGFDYDPYFGGSDGSNTTGSYYFSVDTNFSRLWASLAWNIQINPGSGEFFDGTPTAFDFALYLYEVTDAQTPRLLASSTQSGGSTQNLWLRLKKDKNYLLQVKPPPGQVFFVRDYALAWRIEKAASILIPESLNP